MNIDSPKKFHTPALRALWREAFSDSEDFLDSFFETAFSPERCRCAWLGDELVAALYWFDSSYDGGRVAYIYAVATARAHQGKGLCTSLMKSAHCHLKSLGYDFAVLVPGSKELFRFYEKMRYQTSGYVREFECKPSEKAVKLRKIEIDEYRTLRRLLLPEGSVIQENEALDFLKRQAELYAGEDFLLTARKEEGRLFGIELLGNKSVAPDILFTLGAKEGKFRTPDGNIPFAMSLSLNEKAHTPPSYFGIAFD